MKYSKLIGALAGIGLIVICFMPWTYHADVGKNFTGFFSEKGTYGKPGNAFVLFTVIFLSMTFISKVWAKRINLFVTAIMVAYAIKTYILFTSCYNAYCPEKKPGIYLVLIFSFILLLAAVFPELKIDKKTDTNKEII